MAQGGHLQIFISTMWQGSTWENERSDTHQSEKTRFCSIGHRTFSPRLTHLPTQPIRVPQRRGTHAGGVLSYWACQPRSIGYKFILTPGPWLPRWEPMPGGRSFEHSVLPCMMHRASRREKLGHAWEIGKSRKGKPWAFRMQLITAVRVALADSGRGKPRPETQGLGSYRTNGKPALKHLPPNPNPPTTHTHCRDFIQLQVSFSYKYYYYK